MGYAELHCISNFSFLRGASHPHELVERAIELDYQALAITDECSLAGVVRAHIAAKSSSLKLIIGAEFFLSEGLHLVLIAPNRRAYGELSGLITRARLNSPKGEYQLSLNDCAQNTSHCLAIWMPAYEQHCFAQQAPYATTLTEVFKKRLWLGFSRLHRHGEQAFYERCHQLAAPLHIPMLACGNVHMHERQRKPLQDTLSAIRLNTPIQQLGRELLGNSEHYLRELKALEKL
ncbi:MAG TPA: error-prone DNA polymerase, partial [Spongiibacteraceae bacterium]|nr:error-prone DNA polymerase [Spongiibacteraceae bacterium]